MTLNFFQYTDIQIFKRAHCSQTFGFVNVGIGQFVNSNAVVAHTSFFLFVFWFFSLFVLLFQ